jgi:hypothetical protein
MTMLECAATRRTEHGQRVNNKHYSDKKISTYLDRSWWPSKGRSLLVRIIMMNTGGWHEEERKQK